VLFVRVCARCLHAFVVLMLVCCMLFSRRRLTLFVDACRVVICVVCYVLVLYVDCVCVLQLTLMVLLLLLLVLLVCVVDCAALCCCCRYCVVCVSLLLRPL